MNRESLLFLEAFKAALEDRIVPWGSEVPPETLVRVMNLAERHKVLPMIYQSVRGSEAAMQAGPQWMARYRSATMHAVMLQTRKAAELMPVLEALQNAGVKPLVVKGIICRRLYPHPDQRFSTDEDILVPEAQFAACNRVLESCGLATKDPNSEAYELPYFSREGSLYLEMHKSLFSPENEAFRNLNRFFYDVAERAIVIDGVPTLGHTDHMLFLICHAYKHFALSGFGLRQVADMMLFAEKWGDQIDWEYVLDCSRQIRAERFAATLFRLGEEYLGFSVEKANYPACWQKLAVAPDALLQDMLEAGIYGKTDLSRLHSSTITVNAVADSHRGKRGGGILKTVFPPAKALEKDYPYLKKNAALLPLAWTQRLIKYGRESGTADNRATESIRVGKERVALLRQYGIIDE
jgi:hypothetical protein